MRQLALIVMTASLAACASGPQPMTTGPTTVPSMAAAWQAPTPKGDAASNLAQWWSRADDPVLPALIDAAQSVSEFHEITRRQQASSQLLGNFLAQLAQTERHENWRSLYRLPPATIHEPKDDDDA